MTKLNAWHISSLLQDKTPGLKNGLGRLTSAYTGAIISNLSNIDNQYRAINVVQWMIDNDYELVTINRFVNLLYINEQLEPDNITFTDGDYYLLGMKFGAYANVKEKYDGDIRNLKSNILLIESNMSDGIMTDRITTQKVRDGLHSYAHKNGYGHMYDNNPPKVLAYCIHGLHLAKGNEDMCRFIF